MKIHSTKKAFVNKSLLAITLLFVLSSCRSYREIPYFQEVNRNTVSQEDITNYSPLTIQPDDIIGINVLSLNADASAAFNYNATNNPNIGYVVNQRGEIKLPLVGNMKVSGLTTDELRTQLQRTLLTYLREPTVNVRILNFKVSVFGDVLRPDVYSVANGERLTLPEALAMAGDLNITGLREVLLIRERNGKREYVPLDLKSKNIFNSPYYYLKNNDMIYVQPHKTKLAIVENSKFSVGLTVLSILGFALTQALIR
ncbi:polysaccharide biosynthesis/export family protein [Paradesertivirga mongoliensis]|uniref:Polysaccharide biosynthesis/export family protein n=1 Tax=Paradesertivirga mongoliensis TaxID=2100740 RepID=A0ABW4ZI72_9SPHI|nr:polysaccharide biosynthesis/export family protein [Pedobacter mongoliensis]